MSVSILLKFVPLSVCVCIGENTGLEHGLVTVHKLCRQTGRPSMMLQNMTTIKIILSAECVRSAWESWAKKQKATNDLGADLHASRDDCNMWACGVSTCSKAVQASLWRRWMPCVSLMSQQLQLAILFCVPIFAESPTSKTASWVLDSTTSYYITISTYTVRTYFVFQDKNFLGQQEASRLVSLL